MTRSGSEPQAARTASQAQSAAAGVQASEPVPPELRQQMVYEQCKYAALGRTLFSDIPAVQGILLANAMFGAMQRAIIVANSKVVLPDGVTP